MKTQRKTTKYLSLALILGLLLALLAPTAVHAAGDPLYVLGGGGGGGGGTGDSRTSGGGGGGGGAGGYVGDTNPNGHGGGGGDGGQGGYGAGGAGGATGNDGGGGASFPPTGAGGAGGTGGMRTGIVSGNGTAGQTGNNYDANNARGGDGGAGGTAGHTAAGPYDQVVIVGGNGGDGADGITSQGAAGGAGGAAGLTAADLGASSVVVTAGTNGAGGAGDYGLGGAGGAAYLACTGTLTTPSIAVTKPAGGTVTVRIGRLNVSSNTTITVTGTAGTDVVIDSVVVAQDCTLTIRNDGGALRINALDIADGGYIEVDNPAKLTGVLVTAPTLTGETSMALTQGYAATETGAYVMAGDPAVTVTKTSGDAAITWHAATKKLDIAAGLPVGTYPVELTASNGVKPDKALTFTLTVTARPLPPKNQPTVSGANALSGPQGDVGAQAVAVELANAAFGADLALTCTMGGKTAEALATGNGQVRFAFPAADMNALAVGSYPIEVSGAANVGNEPVALTQVGTLSVGAALPTTWTLPETFRASKGLSYQLVEALPEGRALPSLTFKLGNKKAKIDANGLLTAVNTGSVKLTVTDGSGAKRTCKVKVVPNTFSRAKPLMRKGEKGLYASTKRLYYEKGQLKAEVYVYNRTGQAIEGVNAFDFELREGNKVRYSQAITAWPFKGALPDKGFKVYKLTITEAMLPGISKDKLDLGRGQVQALITGIDATGNLCVPLTAGMPGVGTPKDTENAPPQEVEVSIDAVILE